MGLSPKPELPQKPKPPKRVQNFAEDSVRQANFQVELAAWRQAKVEHENLMKIRKAKQRQVRQHAVEKKAPAALDPPPQLSADELRLVGLPALAERGQTADAGTSPLVRRFRLLSGGLERWLREVERIASRCGAGQAPLIVFNPTPRADFPESYARDHYMEPFHLEGLWFDPTEHGGMPHLILHPARTLTDALACAGVQLTTSP